MKFSQRIRLDLAENKLTSLRQAYDSKKVFYCDLTLTNPTFLDLINQRSDFLLDGANVSRIYQPDARGVFHARQLIADAVGEHLCADDLVLTASTSEAYSYLFKLLTNPGDRILIPSPGYPLICDLAKLEALSPLDYPLHYVGGWQIDYGVIEELCEQAKADGYPIKVFVLVSPDNPTGHTIGANDRKQINALAKRYGFTIISDEVFYEYSRKEERVSFAENDEVLSFTLGGLSKFACFPQMKLSWIQLSGPLDNVRRAKDGLERIADSYLSVSSLVIDHLAQLLKIGKVRREALWTRIEENHNLIHAWIKSYPNLSLLHADGGWMAILRLPDFIDEESLALELLEKEKIFIYPGYFFDLQGGSHLVMSLLLSKNSLEQSFKRLCYYIEAKVNN